MRFDYAESKKVPRMVNRSHISAVHISQPRCVCPWTLNLLS